MEDPIDFKNQYCFGCLCSNNEYVLEYYKLRNRVLQMIFQADKIGLCYICRKMAEHTEYFIQTVQSNQILLENVHKLTALDIKSEKAKMQPLKSLSRVGLEIIELSGEKQTNSNESFLVIDNCSGSDKNTIKVELKEEDGEMFDLNLEHESFSGIDNCSGKEKDTNTVELKEEDGGILDLNLDHESFSDIDNCSDSEKDTSVVELKEEDQKSLDLNLEHESFSVIDICSDSENDTTTVELKEEDGEMLDFNLEHESFVVINNCSDSEKDTSTVELKEKDGGILGLNFEEDVNDNVNDFQERTEIRKETLPLEETFKQALETGAGDTKYLRKSKDNKLKNETAKQKNKTKINNKEDTELQYIEKIYLTRDQCLEERIKMAEDRKYLNAMYKCKDCIKGFTFKNSYKEHMQKHSESYGDYECDICKQRVKSEEKLFIHKRNHIVRHKCSECGLVRVSRFSIKDHYSACHGHYKHACTQCSKVFNREQSLRKHIAYTHTNTERVICAYCHKSYASKAILLQHMTIMHPMAVSVSVVRKKHVCQECGMALKTSAGLKKHSTKHSKSRDYHCVECNKSYKSEEILNHHLKTTQAHVKNTQLPLPCLYCDKRFAIRRSLERHTNRLHLNIKPYECDLCQKAYLTKSYLRDHQRVAHEGYKKPRKHPCSMCDKMFSRVRELKNHIRTHTGERPFQCSKCPAQFNQTASLQTHNKLVHLKLTRDGRPKELRPSKKQSAKRLKRSVDT